MLKKLTAIALFLALAVPGTSHAINMCTSAQTDCATIEIAPGLTGVSIQLWLNTEAVDAFGHAGNVTADGTTSFTARTNGPDTFGGCDVSGIPGQVFGWACGDGRTIPSGTNAHFMTLTVNTGLVGDEIVLTGGSYLSSGFGGPDVENVTQVLVSIVPEPGSVVLLGAGLAGLAFLRRKRA